MRAACLAVALGLAACQLVVGDIELPNQIQVSDEGPDEGIADVGPDSEPDDEPDADDDSDDGVDETPDDAAVDADLDAQVADAWIQDAVAPDGPLPDGPLPDAAPPRPLADLTRLDGVWHVYLAEERDEIALHQVILRIGGGRARLEGFDGAELEPDTVFVADEARRGGVKVNLFPVVGPMVGAMDPQTGFGVLVNDPVALPQPAVAFLVRRDMPRVALPTASVYAHAQFAPTFGAGEIGLLSNPNEDMFSLIDRRLVGGQDAENVGLTRRDHSRTRHRLGYADGSGTVYSPVPGRLGAAGYLDGADGGVVGLSITWAAGSAGAQPLGGDYFCGGFTNRDAALWVRGDDALIDSSGRITWANGGIATMMWQPGVLHLESRDNFFGYPGGIALVEPSERAYVLMPATLPQGDDQAEIEWGFGACVTLAPPQ